MSTTSNQNPSNQPDEQAQQPDATVALLARLEALEQQNKDLLERFGQAQQQASPTKSAPEDKGGVWVEQWRTIRDEDGDTKKVDKQKQYYAADVFDRMTSLRDGKTEADMKDSFGHNGYSYKIIEDTRKKKK